MDVKLGLSNMRVSENRVLRRISELKGDEGTGG
jgi:hypothetical protein